MSILSTIFGSRSENKKLEAQEIDLDSLHKLLEEGCKEVNTLKEQLVTKANGSLYPTLVPPKR